MKKILISICFILAAVQCCACGRQTDGKITARVTKINDGDTFEIDGRRRVRLIGVDTPECYECDKLYKDAKRLRMKPLDIIALGRKARAFTKMLIENQTVELSFDPVNADTLNRDKYGRLLAYVYLPSRKNLFLNRQLLEKGYAVFLPYFNFEYYDLFSAIEKMAQKHKSGIWDPRALQKNLTGDFSSMLFHSPAETACEEVKNTAPDNLIWFYSEKEAESLGFKKCKRSLT